MKIRPIQPKDNAVIKQILRADLKATGLAIPGTAYFDENLDTLNTFYDAQPNRAYFVAVSDDGQVLGGAGCGEFDAPNGIAELQKLYLDEDARGQGLSYQLIDRVTAFAKDAGYRQLYLETHHNLTAAVHIYRKLGFRQLADMPAGVSHNTMDLFFIKDL